MRLALARPIHATALSHLSVLSIPGLDRGATLLAMMALSLSSRTAEVRTHLHAWAGAYIFPFAPSPTGSLLRGRGSLFLASSGRLLPTGG